MNMKLFHSFCATLLMFCLCAAPSHGALNALPSSVANSSKLAQVGSGTYHKWGFSIYKATLWAPAGNWDAKQAYALQLRYNRDLSKETLVSSVVDSLREQGVADDATLEQWQKIVNETLPAVSKNDEIIVVTAPGKQTHIYLNGKSIASITDQAFAKAFFGIWLGDKADPDLRASLLGSSGSQARAGN